MILVQNVVIAALVLTYTGRSLGRAAFVAAMGAVGYSLFNSEVVDMAGLKWLQAGAGVVGVLSKVPQVVQVWQDGSTGVLSAFTVRHNSLPVEHVDRQIDVFLRLRGCWGAGNELQRDIQFSPASAC